MTGDEMNGLVDKLADKLDVAVDKVMPVAQEALDQFVGREIVYALACGFGALFFGTILIVVAVICLKKYQELAAKDTYSDGEGFAVIGGLCGVAALAAIVSLSVNAVCHVGKALAPLAALIGI